MPADVQSASPSFGEWGSWSPHAGKTADVWGPPTPSIGESERREAALASLELGLRAVRLASEASDMTRRSSLADEALDTPFTSPRAARAARFDGRDIDLYAADEPLPPRSPSQRPLTVADASTLHLATSWTPHMRSMSLPYEPIFSDNDESSPRRGRRFASLVETTSSSLAARRAADGRLPMEAFTVLRRMSSESAGNCTGLGVEPPGGAIPEEPDSAGATFQLALGLQDARRASVTENDAPSSPISPTATREQTPPCRLAASKFLSPSSPHIKLSPDTPYTPKMGLRTPLTPSNMPGAPALTQEATFSWCAYPSPGPGPDSPLARRMFTALHTPPVEALMPQSPPLVDPFAFDT